MTGTAQESRLAIVIDTKGAEERVKRLRDALNGLGGTANTAGAGANAASTASQRLGRDANTTTTSIDRLRAASSRLVGPINTLRSSFAGLFAAVGVLSIFKTADAMQSLNSKIKLATNSSEEYLTVQGKLRDMAQSNLTQYDSLVDLYSSSRRALKQLGKTQNETLAFTENITKAMFVGGGAASSQAAALVQLGQALASGVLRGDEFNSIAEQAPILLELVAQKMGVAQGSLRKLAADGKISSRILYDAISDATEKLSDMAAKMPATMGQGFETVKNRWKFFIDDMLNSTGGFSSVVAGALIGLSQNLSSLIPILVAGGLAWGAYALATSTAAATGMASAVTSMISMGYWFTSNTLLVNAQIVSYFNLSAMLARYSYNMMIARLTLANYKDIVITTALSIQAKVKAMQSSIAANIADAATILRNGEATFRLGLVTIGATIAIVNKVKAMRAGVTTASAYAFALRGVAGAAAVTVTAVTGLKAALISLGSIIKAHPIMIIGSVLLAFVAASKNAEGKILGLSGAMKSLGDAVKVLGYVLVDIIGGIKDVANTFGRFIVSMITNSEKGANESSNMFEVFFGNTEGGFVGLLQVIARFADLGGAVMKTFVEALGRGFNNMTIDVSNKFAAMGNFIIEIMNSVASSVTNVINGALDKVSSAIKMANQLPFVNIADKGHRAVAKQITTRFNENKPQNKSTFGYDLGKNYGDFSGDGAASRLQGHIDSMKGAKLEAKANLDLAGAITATGDEADKAKDKKVKAAKKVKEAVDKEREAFERLMESFNQQMTTYAKEGFMGEAFFPTEARDIAFEMKHELGKFFGLSREYKKELSDAAKSADAFRVSLMGRSMFVDLNREIEDLSANNPVEKLLNQFNDITNVLSTLDVTAMKDLLKRTADLDAIKQSIGIQETVSGIQRQIELLNTTNDLELKNLEIDHERLDLIKKFAYLKDLGLNDMYDSIMSGVDNVVKGKQAIVLLELQKAATNSVLDTTKGLNKEIALFGKTGSLDEFIYDLNETERYAHATGDSIDKMAEALTKLDNLKRGDALTSVMDELAQESPLDKIEADYQRRLEAINDYESQWTELLGVHSAERTAIEKSYMDAKQQLMLGQSEAMFGALAGMAKGFLGEQSAVYRGLYAIEKAYTLSSALLGSKKAIMDAWANTPGGYFAKSFAVGKVVLSTSAITSAIAGLSPKGFKAGGYTGNMGVNQVAGQVHGQEYVFDAQSTKNIGVDNLNAMRSGKMPSNGASEVNITVNVDAQGNSSMTGDQSNAVGKQIAAGTKALVMDILRKEKRQGGLLYD